MTTQTEFLEIKKVTLEILNSVNGWCCRLDTVEVSTRELKDRSKGTTQM